MTTKQEKISMTIIKDHYQCQVKHQKTVVARVDKRVFYAAKHYEWLSFLTIL
jgi:hypothetical protein